MVDVDNDVIGDEMSEIEGRGNADVDFVEWSSEEKMDLIETIIHGEIYEFDDVHVYMDIEPVERE